MSIACQNPARPQHEIADGARKITVESIVAWGQDDLRGDWAGSYLFCSFGCLSEWAAARAADHDGVVLRDGGAVEQLTPDQVEALAPTVAAGAKVTDPPTADADAS